jgi:hypothetical protein
MHDEDNAWGLNVVNQRGDSWVAYGDHCYSSPQNAKNREIQKEGLSASAEAVLQAWTQGDNAACAADTTTKSLIPDYARLQDPTKAQEQNNGSPMFVPVNKCSGWFCSPTIYGEGEMTVDHPYCRDDVCKMDRYEWNNDFYRISTYAKLAMCDRENQTQS